jgi:glucose-6-phosphate 1-dehydrogenase
MDTNDHIEPTLFVIFGAAGDLTWRKLIPALFDLFQERSMPVDFSIIAVDRVDMNNEKLRRHLRDGVKKFSRQGIVETRKWSEFAGHIRYQKGDFMKLQTYTVLGEHCTKLEKAWGAKTHRIFYMAIPPNILGEIPKFLGKVGLARDRKLARIVVEKPIGHDLESARVLNAILPTISTSLRSSASTIIWARKLCRTFWRFVLLILFLNRSGTAVM